MNLTDWEISYRYAKTMRADLGTLQDYVYDKMLIKQEYHAIKSHYSELVQLFNNDPRQRMVVTMCDCAKGHYFSVQLEDGCKFLPYATPADRSKLLLKMDYRYGFDYYSELLRLESLGLFQDNALVIITNAIERQHVQLDKSDDRLQSWIIACIVAPDVFPRVRSMFCSGKNYVLDFNRIKNLNLPHDVWNDIVHWDVHTEGSVENFKLWEMARQPVWNADTFFRLQTVARHADISWHPHAHQYYVLTTVLGGHYTEHDVHSYFSHAPLFSINEIPIEL